MYKKSCTNLVQLSAEVAQSPFLCSFLMSAEVRFRSAALVKSGGNAVKSTFPLFFL